MTGRRARRALDRILAANSLGEVLACPPDARGDVYEALLELQEPSPWWQQVIATVARRRSVTPAYVVDRAMAWLATLAELRRHDLYAFFGVEPGATADDIRNRWRALAKRYHPDNGGADPVLFRRFQEAYAILSDPVQRMRYEDGWRRRNGPAVALIAQAARPARRRQLGTAQRAKSGLRRLQAWAGGMRANTGPALRTIGLAAAIVLVVRFGRLPEWPSTPAEDPPAVVAAVPKAAVPAPVPPSRPPPPPPQALPAPVVVLAPTPSPPVVAIAPKAPAPVAPAPFGETVADAAMLAQAEPVVVDGMTLLPEPAAAAPSGLMAPVVSVARSPRTSTPAALSVAAAPAPSTTRNARPAAAADTATPAGRRGTTVTAEVVPTTPPPPVMRLAAAVAAPPVANAAAQDRRPAAPATTLPLVGAQPVAAPPAVCVAKAPPPSRPAKVADKRAKPSKHDKNAKVAAAKKPVPHVVAKAAAPVRPVAMVTAPTGMMMTLTSPEPLDLRSAQVFVREFARRYSAHEAMGLLEMFAPGGSADGRHGVAIADGFGATFRRLGDVRLEPVHVELQPMASGAVVRADYTLFVPGRDPVRGRAQWTLVREGGNVRAAQMLSSTVSK